MYAHFRMFLILLNFLWDLSFLHFFKPLNINRHLGLVKGTCRSELQHVIHRYFLRMCGQALQGMGCRVRHEAGLYLSPRTSQSMKTQSQGLWEAPRSCKFSLTKWTMMVLFALWVAGSIWSHRVCSERNDMISWGSNRNASLILCFHPWPLETILSRSQLLLVGERGRSWQYWSQDWIQY